MARNYSVNIEDLIPEKLSRDKEVYRSNVNNKEKYTWRVVYKQSDLLVSSNKDIKKKIEEPLKEIYKLLEFCIEKDSSFKKSLSPVKPSHYFPRIVVEMCQKTSVFNVGPMAAVAGVVCDYLAGRLQKYCDCLIIENGGDVYIKSNKDVNVGVYIRNKYFKNSVALKVRAGDTPCGLCSSSSKFGHSLSFGHCDLAVVSARSVISADGAATAVANSVNNASDVKLTLNYFKKFDSIDGILIIKDDNIGLWGNIELLS